jgi:superfamily I DNA/RNA helicase
VNSKRYALLGQKALWRNVNRRGGELARVALESGDIPTGEFDHVIIDEHQDLTAAEQHLVEEIWSKEGSLVVLGDDDQSIYSFR